MDYMSNTFPSEQESIRLTDFYKISSSILKRELTLAEKEQLRLLIPSTSGHAGERRGVDGMVEKVTILSLIYRVSDRSTLCVCCHHSLFGEQPFLCPFCRCLPCDESSTLPIPFSLLLH